MANYNKSFNFRNGVQVDNDNFIVNANGLVGIGTSIPTESLDVYGIVKVTGLVTARNLAVTGVSTFYSNVNIGSGITLSPSTGTVNATAFYGDGSTLSNIVGYSTNAWIVNIAQTGISTTLNVGIGTTAALDAYDLVIGSDPLVSEGISFDGSTGNVYSSGIVTAAYFDGIGSSITQLNANNISSGTLSNSRLPSSISVSQLTGSLTGNVTGNVIGIASTALGLSGTPNITVGFATANQGFTGNLTGIASTALSLSGTPNITVSNVNSSNINNTGIITSSRIISGFSSVGVSTVSTRLYAESIGVGTNSPSGDIHIRRSSTSTLQVTSDTAEAIVAVGRSTSLTGSNGAIRFGNTSGLYPYSNSKTLDIINYDIGNINQYLHYGSTGVGTGNFNWIYAPNSNNPLMSLTYGGNLGLGVTNPTVKLQVSGIASVSSLVSQNITATGNVVATGTGTSISARTLYVYGGKSQILNSNGTEIFPAGDGNLNLTTGISTFYDINVTNNGIFGQNIGIGTTNPLAQIHIADIGGNSSVLITGSSIGIGTTSARSSLDVLESGAIFGSVGIGTTTIGNEDTNFYVVGNSEFYGSVGIGTTNPTSKLTVRGGDISVGTNNSHGVILTSPNGTQYRLVVSNAGALSTVAV